MNRVCFPARVGVLACLFLAAFEPIAFGDTCDASHLDVAIHTEASAAIGVQTAFSGSDAVLLAECRYAPWPAEPVATGTRFEVSCEKRKSNGKRIASGSLVWDASLVGERFPLIRRSVLTRDEWPAVILIDQTTMGNIALNVRFDDIRTENGVYVSGVDLLGDGQDGWNVEWKIGASDDPRHTESVRCSVRRQDSPSRMAWF